MSIAVVATLGIPAPVLAMRQINPGQHTGLEEELSAALGHPPHVRRGGLEEAGDTEDRVFWGTLEQHPEFEEALIRIADRVNHLADPPKRRYLRSFREWLRNLDRHAPFLKSHLAHDSLALYVDAASFGPLDDLFSDPVVIWRFEERDIHRWDDQDRLSVASVYRLMSWAAQRWVRPGYLDQPDQEPFAFALRVTFQEFYRRRAIEEALSTRMERVRSMADTQWVRRELRSAAFAGLAKGRYVNDKEFAEAERNNTFHNGLQRVVGWWQWLTRYPLHEAVPEEIIEALARRLISAYRIRGDALAQTSFDNFYREIAQEFLDAQSRPVRTPGETTNAGSEELPAPEVMSAPSVVETRGSIQVGA